ncbi:MAG: hypothetical protein JWN48_4961 [Myxococcaceae bacterium]|nr:hypothetical protein [Myxococcaceae bacterium]
MTADGVAGASVGASAPAITADRVERKYVLRARAVHGFVRAVAKELPLHRFTGEGANLLPDAQHFVTSIYFDTPTHAHLRAANDDREHNVKVRAREYYDLQPSLAELATDPSQIVRYQPWVWFEVKERDVDRSRKLRFRLPKKDVAAFFRKEHAAFRAPDQAVTEPSQDLSSIVSYLNTLVEPLVPSCIVNYRRIALQDASSALRVTVDSEIGFYAPPDDLWQRSQALVRGTFGKPARVENGALVELKCVGVLPRWLERAVQDAGANEVAYSKFVEAGKAVHG